ncbi:MAG: hypothetical protein ACJAUP_003493 [Cellvibrionaceae bacterium]|jgi:hypothetical protein
MINNRQHLRHTISVSLKITHETIDEIIVETKNISDGGLFVVVNPNKMPPMGTIVKGQVQGMVEESPVVEMEVVRVANHGIGLKYINL